MLHGHFAGRVGCWIEQDHFQKADWIEAAADLAEADCEVCNWETLVAALRIVVAGTLAVGADSAVVAVLPKTQVTIFPGGHCPHISALTASGIGSDCQLVDFE